MYPSPTRFGLHLQDGGHRFALPGLQPRRGLGTRVTVVQIVSHGRCLHKWTFSAINSTKVHNVQGPNSPTFVHLTGLHPWCCGSSTIAWRAYGQSRQENIYGRRARINTIYMPRSSPTNTTVIRPFSRIMVPSIITV